jgi:nicotinamidase-related amidase
MTGMTTALLVIDVQESFRARPEWADIQNPAIADRIALLVEAARERDEPVFWVLHTEPGSETVFDPAEGHVRVLGELSPRADEPLLHKTSINAFTSTDLEARLRDAGVDRVVICGIRTEQCCETTARVASDLGFDVVFVTDATTTSAIGDLSAAEIIARTETVLRGREFATISTTAEFTSGLAAMAS